MPKSNSRNINCKNPFEDSNYTKLFNDLYSSLWHFSISLVGDHEVAEDIVQDLFVYIWENRERLVEIDSMKSYLLTAVKHRSIDYLKKKYNSNRESIDNISELNFEGTLPNPADILENKELGILLEKALKSLPEKCRIIFTMKKIGGYTNKQVATELNISVKTVENQMTIALKKLIAYISNNWNNNIIDSSSLSLMLVFLKC